MATTSTVLTEAVDETLIRDQVAKLAIPEGVKFARVELSESWTGEPMWKIYFTVSKKVSLTRKRVKQLVALKGGLSLSLLNAGITYFPLVSLLDGN